MFHMPTSSPNITRMLGLSCAEALTDRAKMATVARSHNSLIRLVMEILLLMVSWFPPQDCRQYTVCTTVKGIG